MPRASIRSALIALCRPNAASAELVSTTRRFELFDFGAENTNPSPGNRTTDRLTFRLLRSQSMSSKSERQKLTPPEARVQRHEYHPPHLRIAGDLEQLPRFRPQLAI